MPIVKRKTAGWIRKAHRYLGIFLGLQFLMWTISGIYFSWTNIDEIHGDHFRKAIVPEVSFSNLNGVSQLVPSEEIRSLQLKDIAGEPYYFINEKSLVHAINGEQRAGITEAEALRIAQKHMLESLQVAGVEKITTTGNHHEYRNGKLPAYVISYSGPHNVKAYVSVEDGSFRSVRYRDWRWFDFLWMTHTMDYAGRDDFNTTLLRAFSLLGLITVLSGFVLWFISSPRMIKIFSSSGSRVKV